MKLLMRLKMVVTTAATVVMSVLKCYLLLYDVWDSSSEP
jgi:hypothetical protein